MIKNGVIIVALLIFPLNFSYLYAEDVSQFRLQGDLSTAPLFYEPQSQLLFTNIATDWFFGYKAYWFSIGVDAFIDYYALKSQNQAAFFRGAWFDIRSTVSAYVMLNKWLEIKAGAGGLWLRSAFENNNSGILAQNSLGLSFLLDLQFYLPWSFLDIELKNSCDLLYVNSMDNNFLGLLPTYKGGIRFNFHPGISWGSLYLELNGFYWDYRSEINNINIWTFKIDVGLAMRLDTPQRTYTHPYDAYLLKPPKEPEKEPVILKPPKEIDLNEENLAKIGNAKAGEQFTFTNITFVKGSSQLDQPAKNALDKLVLILKKYKNLYFSISGYSELMGDPRKELDLSVARADKIKTYLTTKNIETERLKLIQVGQLSTRIVFTVIKN